MSHLSEHVDSLENKISKLLHRYTKLQQEKANLEIEVGLLKDQQLQSQLENEKLKETCSSLKLANSMLGSDQHKRDTKLKINALVREIDQCITQLSE
jgi:chromosome segregation ATPase